MELTYVPLLVVSCAFFLYIYKYVSPRLSGYFCPGYKDLPFGKQVEWNTRTLSSLHAMLVSMSCIYAFLYDEDMHNDTVWGNSIVVRAHAAFVIGYMLSDAIIMLVYYKEIGEVFYIFHHGAVIYAYYYVMVYSVFCWFANFRLLAELSTPFVNLRWFMDVLGYPRSSKMFMVNGFLMTFVFFFIRIIDMPWYWYRVYLIYGTPAVNDVGGMFGVLISSCIVLDVINFYWFTKIYSGAKKVLLSGGKSSANSIDRKTA